MYLEKKHARQLCISKCQKVNAISLSLCYARLGTKYSNGLYLLYKSSIFLKTTSILHEAVHCLLKLSHLKWFLLVFMMFLILIFSDQKEKQPFFLFTYSENVVVFTIS